MTTRTDPNAGRRMIEAPPLTVTSLTTDTLALRLADCVAHPRRWSAGDRLALMAEASHRLWGEGHTKDLLTAWDEAFAS